MTITLTDDEYNIISDCMLTALSDIDKSIATLSKCGANTAGARARRDEIKRLHARLCDAAIEADKEA